MTDPAQLAAALRYQEQQARLYPNYATNTFSAPYQGAEDVPLESMFFSDVVPMGVEQATGSKLAGLLSGLLMPTPTYKIGGLLRIVGKKPDSFNSLNPTGGLFVKYTPKTREVQKLGPNIVTLDKTTGKHPDDLMVIYRGAPPHQKEIVPGDFITDDLQLATDYAGTGKVLQKTVRVRDVLDDLTEPLGGEYVYRPHTRVGK